MTHLISKRTPLERLILQGMGADHKEGAIELNPARWLGVSRLTPAQAQACCRAYRRLERAGVVELIRAWGGRVTALRRIQN